MSLENRTPPKDAVLYHKTNRRKSAIAWIMSHIIPGPRMEELKETDPNFRRDTSQPSSTQGTESAPHFPQR